jgi:hypothetical protein
MKKGGFVISMVVVLVALLGYLLLAAVAERVERPTSKRSARPSHTEEVTPSGQVVPDKGPLPPQPELTPEERERLLQGVNKAVPDAPRSDAERPSQPAGPSVPGVQGQGTSR